MTRRRRTPGERSRAREPSDELREKLATCFADGCGNAVVWRHRSVWGPHWCDECVDHVPDELEYLYRRVDDGAPLEDRG